MKALKLTSLLVLLTSLFAACSSETEVAVESTPENTNRFFELRIYHTNEGKLPELKNRFRDHTMAIFDRLGMEDLGYWEPKDNPDGLLIYFLEFDDRADRDAKWKIFVDDPAWKAAYASSTANGGLVSSVDSLYLEATDYSPLVETGILKPGSIYEFRSYIASEGNLENLDARFRDATVGLFAKHGATNLGYWHLTDGQENADSRLVYLLEHDSEDARNATFGAFGKDPEWQAAKKASEEHAGGGLTSGVEHEYWMPILF